MHTLEEHFLALKEALFVVKAKRVHETIGQEVTELLGYFTDFHDAPTVAEPAHSGYTTVKLPTIEL